MDAESVVAIVLGVLFLVGWCCWLMWKNRRHNEYVGRLEARDKKAREKKRDAESKAREAYRIVEPVQDGAADQSILQLAGAHGAPMQFISPGMPQNVTHQYVTVVTQPHY